MAAQGTPPPPEATPYEFTCPIGTFVVQINGRSGWLVDALGPIVCSDNSSSAPALWGSDTNGGPFQHVSPSGYSKIDLLYDYFAMYQIALDANSIYGGTSNSGQQQSATLACPAGMVVAGVFGAYDGRAYRNFIDTLGLVCRSGVLHMHRPDSCCRNTGRWGMTRGRVETSCDKVYVPINL